MGVSHRTKLVPIDAKMRKKKKYKKPKEFVLTNPIRTEEEAEKTRSQGDDPDLQLRSQMAMERLCAGENLRTPEEDKDLRCLYGHGGSDWLRLGPLKVEVRSKVPYVAVLRELMFESECDNITQFLGPHLDFPPGRMSTRQTKNDWTMKK